jgi:hypothetical protein
VSLIAILDMDVPTGTAPSEHPSLRDRLRPVDCYGLPDTDLRRYAGLLVVDAATDQEFLYRHRTQVADYLDAGGVVVFGGHLFRQWLPGAQPFVPKSMRSFRDYEVRILASHPIFAGVEERDLTLRKGVAGFFARGHHALPNGAQALVSFGSGEVVTYVDRATTRGTILVQATSGLLGCVDAETTAARIPGQLLDWVARVSRLPAAPP